MKLIYPQPTKLLLLSLSAVLLLSCSPTKFYSYDIQLEKPVLSQNLQFENDTISISFTFHQKDIELELYNKLDDGLKINWNEVSISINEQAQGIVSYSAATNEIFEPRKPTMIPPRSKFNYTLIPKGKISCTRNGQEYTYSIQNSYPQCDYGNKNVRKKVQQLKGQKISIFLPYYLKDLYHSKTFEFTVRDVKARQPRPYLAKK
jgi:hypothetical protein